MYIKPIITYFMDARFQDFTVVELNLCLSGLLCRLGYFVTILGQDIDNHLQGSRYPRRILGTSGLVPV